MAADNSSFSQRLKSFFLKILLGVLVLLVISIWVCSWTYSEGTRAGRLIKIANKGFVFKTNEGELNLGGLRMDGQDDALEGNIWAFSIIDKQVLEQVKDYEGRRVKLKYKQRYKSLPWQAKTDYIVIGVETMEP